MKANKVRQSFKDFFESKQHKIVPSAPMVVKNDPTLMFTNAGMNQFKDIFLGNSPSKYPRISDSQKCLRVSGKHNDLEEVGHDTYHHTMFEMLGNWSFGDYFKPEAIDWAWEFLVDVLHIPADRLYVTVFEGNKDDKLEADMEAFALWQKHLPSERILYGSKKDNFWEMGDTGPCGPCSEIHIDIRDDAEREKTEGSTLVNTDNPHVIEIWNLVFIQFNRMANGELLPLPNKHVDTGMGFERLCMVVQGKKSNYDTDVFQPIINEIAKISGKQYNTDAQSDVAMRVIADHLRAISFSIADGQLPSNLKAGYVIRRILRRAVRYGYTFLNFSSPFIYKLVDVLSAQMGDAFPELRSQKELIQNVIYEEENAFLRTLETGIKRLELQINQLKKSGNTTLQGKEAFELYDTYGFPLDLTQLILAENNLEANTEEFNTEMQKQKERARNAASAVTNDWVILSEGEQNFAGYDSTECQTEILRYRKVKQKEHEFYQIVLSQTPFYAESGGQAGDTGWLVINDNENIEIFNTKKENELSLHYSHKLPQDTSKIFRAVINTQARTATASNHTATHLLHEALRTILGTHVEQKGSLVTPNSLRFDFSHFSKLTDEEIRKTEQKVNQTIRKNIKLKEYRNININEARNMGAIALFGEKYGEEVRIIKFGTSIELCGGTHSPATGNIGIFKIISESSIAAGIRRIEAVTAEKAEEYINSTFDTIREIKALLNNTPNLLQTIQKELDLSAELKKQVEEFKQIRTQQIKATVIKQKNIKNGTEIYTLCGEYSNETVKEIATQLRGELKGKAIFVAGTVENSRPNLTVLLTNEAVSGGLNASNLVREAAKLIQGGGGGQPYLATAGGKDAGNLSTAVEKILEMVQ